MKDTSIEAFHRVKYYGTDQRHRDIILKAMHELNEPATSEVISVHCKLDYHQVARRMPELERLGLVRYNSQIRGRTSSGSTAGKWSLTSSQLMMDI